MATTPVERETAELPFVDTWMNFSGPVEGRARAGRGSTCPTGRTPTWRSRIA